jgi:protease I
MLVSHLYQSGSRHHFSKGVLKNREETAKLQGKKIGILIESDFYEHEIWYYHYRFAEEGAETHLLTRLWGQQFLTFQGHEYHAPLDCHESFEDIDDRELNTYAAIIVPSAFVADRLRYTEDLSQLPPATGFLKQAFANQNILKGIICHGMWLVAPVPELVRDRRVTCHNNLHGDVVNMGAIYTDRDVVVDGDLVTGRSGAHCHLFAQKIIEILAVR